MIELFLSVLVSVIVMSVVGAIVGFGLVVLMSHPVIWVIVVLLILLGSFGKPKI